MLVGYARVSSETQNLDAQIDALKKAGCEKIFSEKITGAKAHRAELENMKKFIRDGQDTVVVVRLDRLGRSLKNLMEEMQEFQRRNIAFKSLEGAIDTSTVNGRLFFHMFAALAEFERDLIKERVEAGLSALRARGKNGGRPSKWTQSQIQLMRSMYADKTNNIQAICETFKISRPSLFRLVRSRN